MGELRRVDKLTSPLANMESTGVHMFFDRTWSTITVQYHTTSMGCLALLLLLGPLQVYPFEQLARLRSLPEEYESPEPKPFKPRVDPSSWLADEQHRDQFVLRYSEPHPSGKLVRARST